MSDSDPWTIRRLLDWTTDFLQRHGSTTPRLDAEVLLAQVRGCDRIRLYTDYNEEASDEVRRAFRELVRRRADGVPVAYLVGHREFFSLDFVVSPDVLIPRPETEYVVVSLLELVKARAVDHGTISIADIGTGSGVLAICSAIHVPDSRIVAVDISDVALAIAAENARRHKVSDRIEFIQSDLFDHCRSLGPFDFIISNPPYVAEREREMIPRDVREHEPGVAVFSGGDGMNMTRRLIEQSADMLVSNGWLIFETAPNHEPLIRSLIESDRRYDVLTFTKDLAGLIRVARVRKAED